MHVGAPQVILGHFWKKLISTDFGPSLDPFWGALAAKTPQNVAKRAHGGQNPHVEVGSSHSERWKLSLPTILFARRSDIPYVASGLGGQCTRWRHLVHCPPSPDAT